MNPLTLPNSGEYTQHPRQSERRPFPCSGLVADGSKSSIGIRLGQARDYVAQSYELSDRPGSERAHQLLAYCASSAEWPCSGGESRPPFRTGEARVRHRRLSTLSRDQLFQASAERSSRVTVSLTPLGCLREPISSCPIVSASWTTWERFLRKQSSFSTSRIYQSPGSIGQSSPGSLSHPVGL